MTRPTTKLRKFLNRRSTKSICRSALTDVSYARKKNLYQHARYSPRSNSNGLLNPEIFSRISQALAASNSLPEIYDHLAGAVFELLPNAEQVHIYRPSPLSSLLGCVYGAHHSPQHTTVMEPAALEPATGMLLREVWHTREPLLVNDLARFLQTLGKSSSLANRATVRPPALGSLSNHPYDRFIPRSALDVPMQTCGDAIGVLEALSARRNSFSNQDLDLLSLAGNTTAAVIQSHSLRRQAEDYTREMQASHSATVDSWRRALELRDRATEGHGMRVAEITVQLAVQLGVESSDLTNIRFGAQLHDIGKIGVPDNILLKPGPLDYDDFEIMKRHPVYAYEMLYSIPNFSPVLDIPYYHHEKWDGTGYPEGLHGDDIPLPARIFAVVDVWDALRSDRPYRSAWPEAQARSYIKDQSGKHFDPRVVEAFLRLLVQKPLVQSIYN